MRNLSSSELSQISGGRRAQSPMLANAGHNNTIKPAFEDFWLGGLATGYTGNFSEMSSFSDFTPFVPQSNIAVSVVANAGGVGVAAAVGGYMGALTTDGHGGFTGTFTDTFSNNAKLNFSVNSGGTVQATVTIPID